MDPDTGPIDEIAFLARSEPRVRILEFLKDNGPAIQRDVRDGVDTSRSTVTRALQAFGERAWVETEGDRYWLTPVGHIVADGFLDLEDTLETARDYDAFLSWFPYGEYDVDLDELRDADVTASSTSDPYAPARKAVSLFETSESVRCLLPSIGLEGVRMAYDRETVRDVAVEVVVSPSVAARMADEEFGPQIDEQVEAGQLTVLVNSEEVPFYLGLGDDGVVQVGVEDDDGFPRATIETTTDPVRAWAEDVYESFRRNASPKPPSDF